MNVNEHNPVGRFSSRVADYVRFRPSYPAAMIAWLAKECGLTSDSIVADVGSGPGVLAKLLLEEGCAVYAVEPNAEMRAAGEVLLRGYPRFHSVAGHAEATTLEPASIDLVTAAQAFHWFDPEKTRQEFSRILRPPGWVALVWNQRLVTGDPFLVGYEALLQRFAPEYREVDHRRIDAEAIRRFFGHSHWRKASFANRQEFDLDGIKGRTRSASYTPQPGAPGYEPMMAELKQLFAATAQDGQVTFAYETNVYAGLLITP
jgi:SAM-dependent methyltransferase